MDKDTNAKMDIHVFVLYKFQKPIRKLSSSIIEEYSENILQSNYYWVTKNKL